MVRSKHTRAWVGYEVGIASERNLPVVVIEPEAKRVELPVPGATVYLQRPKTAVAATGTEWRVLCETGGDLKPHEWEESDGTFWGGILTFLGNAALSSGDSTGAFYSVGCENAHCRARFFAPQSLHTAKRHPCPSCRLEVAHWRVGLNEYLDKRSQEANPSATRKAQP